MLGGMLFLMCLSAATQQNPYWQRKSPYELSVKKDVLISGVSVGILLTGIAVEKNETVPSFQMGCVAAYL